ncbi:tRNA dimethylallyltransferase [Ascoidea rubescens DSM 1968]|uniref:tRNA dimethylallyltransferase n=1 Tax=Ascoidea rubescens DSM 1968 TaxID=1344418 RepID=A0A1D2VIT4_9ASCO|nr:tRNA isopentenyltransferase [Ascoidea rubescens DSM 1968]ODV61470.1 tRNA isopentenyltransferase [Ascoidea rubescens DSM 1968]
MNEPSSKKKIIVIVGTTGVGKSKFSIQLAERYNGEIINADSMQMYKDLDLITNKHPINERQGIPHHIMNHIPWDNEYNIHRFKNEALSKINQIHSINKIPIIIGGTHYYLQSLLFKNKTITTNLTQFDNENTFNINKSDTYDTYNQLSTDEKNLLKSNDSLKIFNKLKEIDPVLSQKFHPNDTRRIKRALEICLLTNKKTSDLYQQQNLNQISESSLRFNTLVFWVWSNQSILNQRLDDRVDDMINNGAIDEISSLYNLYLSKSIKPDCQHGVWQVIGFKEFLPWLNYTNQSEKKIDNVIAKKLFNQSVENMKIKTRQYSKQQIKWIKKTLCFELAKESKHYFINGGLIFLLDTSNLDNWNSNITIRSQQIMDTFLANKSSYNLPQAPEGLTDMIQINEEKFNKPTWKHYQCDVCKQKNGDPLIIVGEETWKIHLNSNKHKSTINRGKRKKEYEEWLKKKNMEHDSLNDSN